MAGHCRYFLSDGGQCVVGCGTSSDGTIGWHWFCGCVCRGLYCGYSLAHLEEIYSHAVELAGFQSDTYDACYVYEPGGLAYCKHIAFYITDGVVTAIQVEDLMDGRLLG